MAILGLEHNLTPVWFALMMMLFVKTEKLIISF